MEIILSFVGRCLLEWMEEGRQQRWSIGVAKGSPTHILLPAPNGISSKFQVLISLSINLSWMNCNGFFEIEGSLPIAHTLTSIWVCLGITNPAIWQRLSVLWGMSKRTGGGNRSTSLTTAWRQGRRSASLSSTICTCPTTSSNSAWTRFIFSGLWMSSAIAHSIVFAVVSAPAPNKSCNKNN